MRFLSHPCMPAAVSLAGIILFVLTVQAAAEAPPAPPSKAELTIHEATLMEAERIARPPRVSADVVTATVVPARLTAEAGGETSFKVRLDIADTWHLYDHSYVHDKESFYYGIDMMPGEGADLAAYQPVYPPGQPGVFLGEKVSLIYKNAEIAVTIKMPESSEGLVAVPLVLTVQACDSKICLQPSEIPIEVQVQIQERAGAKAQDE